MGPESGNDLARCFWFRVSHKVAIRCWLRLQSTESWQRREDLLPRGLVHVAGKFVLLHVDLSIRPLECPRGQAVCFPRASDLRDQGRSWEETKAEEHLLWPSLRGLIPCPVCVFYWSHRLTLMHVERDHARVRIPSDKDLWRPSWRLATIMIIRDTICSVPIMCLALDGNDLI